MNLPVGVIEEVEEICTIKSKGFDQESMIDRRGFLTRVGVLPLVAPLLSFSETATDGAEEVPTPAGRVKTPKNEERDGLPPGIVAVYLDTDDGPRKDLPPTWTRWTDTELRMDWGPVQEEWNLSYVVGLHFIVEGADVGIPGELPVTAPFDTNQASLVALLATPGSDLHTEVPLVEGRLVLWVE